ncbi:hypothetical protein DICPUDRAFT_76980 [Dictyostelium purpureum]|uniref:Uncharacterized protein n=1 Tax=Dictyostelium purpureum TaxID=5786 RepID=F0ZF89_DICPU|nr:uncharacterized protein DICPUDRAFT_76980 [Dictyostelium purpureum]EGC37432.1 hypothetical protein DICPUDRAFT_76980 [Dictyostelium purpureum]|eukprot:XP_003286085.1 hypothetical protein DICPUDRAFT_76980 [Dictyostelium purpureum]
MDHKNYKLYRIILILQVFGFFLKNKDFFRNNNNDNSTNNNNSSGIFSKIGYLFNPLNLISYSSSNNNNTEIKNNEKKDLNNNNNNNVNYNNIENKNEILFWKTIRNKIIFNKILKYLSNGPNFNSYKYYEIIHVDWMINNNKKELLEYKVKNGDYLIFNLPFLNNKNKATNNKNKNKNNRTINLNIYNKPNFQSPQNNDLYTKLFKFIKKDTDFYINLFRNYSNYFLIDIEATIIQAIKEKSFSALKVLFSYYNAKLTIEQEQNIIRNTINTRNFKSLNYIVESKFLRHHPIQITPKDIIILFNDCPFGEIGISTNVANDAVYDLKSGTQDNTNREERSFKLSKLIHACKLINYILDPVVFTIETAHQFDASAILTNDAISLLGFTKQQLNTSIIGLLKSDNNISSSIEKLIKMYLSITNQQNKNIRYYLTFNNGSINDQVIINMEIKETFSKCCMIAFRYGNYTLIKRWFNRLSKTNIFFEMILFQSWVGELFKRYESPDFLFEHCNFDHNKENIEIKKRNFINSICHDISDSELNKDFKFHPLLVFCLCVATDDLDLIKYAHSKLHNLISTIELDPVLLERHLLHHHFSLCLYRYIRSPQVLDYIYKHFNNNGSIPVNGTSITSWYHFGKTNLLKHYQTLIEMNDPEARVPFSRKPYGIENQVSSKSVVHILSNTRKFRIDYHYMIECIDGQFIDIVELDDIKYIISNCHCSAKRVKFNIIMVMTSPKFTQGEKIEFFDWFFRNNPSNYLDYFGDYNMDLNKRILSPTHLNLINGYLYLTGRLDQVLLNNTNIASINNLNMDNPEPSTENASNIIKDITDIYHNLGFKISKNLSLFSHENCDEIFYCIGLLNDTDTLDLLMVLDNHLNSTINNTSSSTLIQQYITNKKRYLFELLCGAVNYGRLSMLQYFYNNYKSIFLEYYHNNNINNNNNNNNLYDNSNTQYNTIILFRYAIINNYYDIVEWFINVLDLKISKSILFDTTSTTNTKQNNNIFTEKDFKNSIIFKNFKNMYI